MTDADRVDAFDDEPGLPGYEMDEWQPGLAVTLIWSLLGLVLTIAAFLALLGITRAVSDSEGFTDTLLGSVEHVDGDQTTITIELAGLGLLILLIAGVLILHEAIHGVAFRAFGGRPTYGAAVFHKVLPVLFCTAHGYYFSRRQYAAIVLAPVFLITLVSLLIILLTDLGYWVIIPAALNFGGAVGDFWIAGMLAQRPPGTIIEDRKDGVRFYRPIDQTES